MTENFDFSLSFGLPPSEKELRLFKSLIAYINALSRFCLGEKEFEEGKFLSATVNLYYSLFHLGVATLVIHEKYDFLFENEFLLPDGSNIGRVKRITNLSHKKLISELQKCGKSSAFIKELSKALEESIPLREFFSYGPYVQMFNKRKEDGFLVVLLFLPASFEDAFGVTKIERCGRPPIKERIERAIIKNRNLINQYPAFVRKKIEKLGATEKVEIQPLFFSLSANLFIHLGPYFPEFIFKRIEKLTETFCESLGDKYFEIYNRGKEFFDKEGFCESMKKGEVIQAIELRIPEKYFVQFSTESAQKNN